MVEIFRKNSSWLYTVYCFHKEVPSYMFDSVSRIRLWLLKRHSLRKMRPYSELSWSAFSPIWTEYGEILRNFPYSVLIRENMDQNNSKYEHFLRSYLQQKAISAVNFE